MRVARMLGASMSAWYYGRPDQQYGPVDEASLRGKVASGEVPGDWLAWREGMSEWRRVAEVAELHGPAVAAVYAPPGAAGMVPGGAMVYHQPTNGLAVASLICGIVSLVTLACYVGGLAGIPAVICGHMALKQIAESPLPQGGRGMAIAGLVTGYIGIALSVLIIFVVIFAIISSGK